MNYSDLRDYLSPIVQVLAVEWSSVGSSDRNGHRTTVADGLSRLPAGLSQTASVRRSAESTVEKDRDVRTVRTRSEFAC